MAYLNILRPINLVFIAVVQLLIKFVLFPAMVVSETLNDWHFALLIFATLAIAGGGYVINDIYDVEIDKINKPNKVIVGKKISSNAALTYYMILTILGVGSGFYISNLIGRPGFAAIFVLVAAMLYLYASYLKSWLIAGNLLVSILVGTSLIIVGIFELLPAITEANQSLQRQAFKVILEYALFALFINFIREIVKDIEDINGDKNGGMNTLPILLGRQRTSNVVIAMGIMAIAAIILYINDRWYDQKLMVAYYLLLVVGPLIYFCIKAYQADKKEDFSRLSMILKVVLFLGMCSLCVYPFIKT